MTAMPTPLTNEEWIVRAYREAVLHISWLLKDGRRQLVFGFLEFLPHGLPASIDEGESQAALPSSRQRLYARHCSLSVGEAVQWYRRVLNHDIARPNLDGTFPGPGAHGTLSGLRLRQDVPWPETNCVDRSMAPFLSPWHETPRIHHLFRAGSCLTAPMSGRDREALESFIDAHFGFSLLSWSMYSGSLHCILPDPFHRRIYGTLEDNGRGETLTLHVIPWQLAPLVLRRDLTVFVAERRGTGLSSMRSASLPAAGSIDFHFGHRVEQLDWWVADPNGVTYRSRTSARRKSIILRQSVSRAEKRTILVRRSDGADGSPVAATAAAPTPAVAAAAPTTATAAATATATPATEELLVHVLDEPIDRQLGDSAPPGDGEHVHALIEETISTFAVRDTASWLRQKWFARNPLGGREYIRQLVESAQRTLVIVDPYLTHYELAYCVAVNRRRDLCVRAMTSSLAVLRGDRVVRTELAALVASYDAVKKPRAQRVGSVEVRMMGKAAFHDRFIVVDDDCFALGASLNEFGARATMSIRIPDPRPVIETIENHWNAAAPVAAITNRRGE